MEKENIKPIVFEIEYGKIIVKLDEIMKKLNVSNYELNSKANSATSLVGYGITDAYTKTEVDNKLANLLTYEEIV